MNILGKRSDLPFSRKSDRKKEKSTVSFTHVQNIICSQTQLDGIAHEQTIICRQLFAGHVVSSRPMKRKKHLHRMIKWVSQLRRFPPIPYPFNFARRCWWGKKFLQVVFPGCTCCSKSAYSSMDERIKTSACTARENDWQKFCERPGGTTRSRETKSS